MEIEKKQLDITCCRAFEQMISSFYWYTVDVDSKQEYLMPCVEVVYIRYRVNYCTVCGANVRGIRIPEEDFKKIYK